MLKDTWNYSHKKYPYTDERDRTVDLVVISKNDYTLAGLPTSVYPNAFG